MGICFDQEASDNGETGRGKLIGTSVIREYRTEDGRGWRPISEAQNDADLTEGMRLLLTTRLVFEADGTLKELSAVPDGVSQEELERAVESGEIKLYDSRTILDETVWKEENGKFYYDTGIVASDCGQAFFNFGQIVSRWREIKETEDGIEWRGCRLVKAQSCQKEE